MSKARKEKLLTPLGVVEGIFGSKMQAEAIWHVLIAQARRQKLVGAQVPVIVIEPDREPYFSVAEDDGKPSTAEGGGA